WPSITSRWIQSAPAASTASTSSPSREKSDARMEGAIRIFFVTLPPCGPPARSFALGCDLYRLERDAGSALDVHPKAASRKAVFAQGAIETDQGGLRRYGVSMRQDTSGGIR